MNVVERVVAGESYWCVSCRYCGTTLALCEDRGKPPMESLADPLQCYSCRARTWYTVEECRCVKARANGAPWAGVGEG